MAYTDYRYDVFISYAHIDNEPTGWVTSFVALFEKWLNIYLGAKCSLLFDERLGSGNASVDDLEDAARNSAILIGIGSPAYARRPWLTRELKAFRERVQADERLFLVEYVPLDKPLAYPSPMDRKIAKRFWTKPANTETPVPLKPSEEQFYPMVLDVAKKVQVQLALRPSPDVPPIVPPPSQAKRILIAQVTDDLGDDADQVRRYLGQYPEFAVLLPDSDYPQGGNEFKAAFQRDLATADIFVQMLGATPGRKPKDLEQGYTRYQFEMAAAQKKTMMLWRHPELDLSQVKDEVYKAIVDGPQVAVCGLEEFKKRVLDAATTEDAPKVTGDEVFVNFDRDNLELAESIKQEFEKAQIRVAMPLFSTVTLSREHLSEKLKTCEGIWFFNGNKAFVTSQRNLFKSVRAEPPSALAVCTVPPLIPPLDEKFFGYTFDELDCSDRFELSPRIQAFIQAFIVKLRGRKRAGEAKPDSGKPQNSGLEREVGGGEEGRP